MNEGEVQTIAIVEGRTSYSENVQFNNAIQTVPRHCVKVIERMPRKKAEFSENSLGMVLRS